VASSEDHEASTNLRCFADETGVKKKNYLKAGNGDAEPGHNVQVGEGGVLGY